MKKILTILATASIAAFVLASCNKNQPPVFDDSRAFVAFSSLSQTVKEAIISERDTLVKGSKGQDSLVVITDTIQDVISIPVSLASVAGLEGSVKFKIVADTTTKKDGTKVVPQEGVNYQVFTEGGTLKFDKDHRTQNIVIGGILFPEYTGDLSINIILESKVLPLGYMNTCKVVISDIDHPLTAILGEYEASSTGEAYQNPWTMTFYKDSEDDHKVWIDNIFANSGWAISTTRVYGNVKEENGKLTSIIIPLGQKVEYKYGTYDVFVYGCKIAGDYIYYQKTGSVTATIGQNESGKVTLDFGEGEYDGFALYIDQNGLAGYAAPHITAVKK